MSQANRSAVITSNTNTQLGNPVGTGSPSEGILHAINIAASTTAGTVTVYDNTSATGTPIAVLGVAANQSFCAILDILFLKGLFIVTASFTSPNVTVSYR